MKERRGSVRWLCSHLVDLANGSGPCPGLLEDLSEQGAGLGVDTAFEPGDQVEVRAPGVRLEGEARYCTRRETDFRVGVRFSSATQWRPEQWRPEHLFLPPAESY